MLFQIFIGLHGYCCYLHVASQSLTPLFKICHVLTLRIGSFLSIGFRGKKFDIFREHVLCTARLVDSVQLFTSRTSTVRCFLSRYHGFHIFVRFFFSDCRSFTSRKLLYIYTETSVSCINLIEFMSLHFPNLFFFNYRQLQTQLSEARSRDRMVNTENPAVYALVTGKQTNHTHGFASEHNKSLRTDLRVQQKSGRVSFYN